MLNKIILTLKLLLIFIVFYLIFIDRNDCTYFFYNIFNYYNFNTDTLNFNILLLTDYNYEISIVDINNQILMNLNEKERKEFFQISIAIIIMVSMMAPAFDRK